MQKHATNKADHLALKEGDRELSYSDLTRECQRWANLYHAIGLSPGDRLGIALRDDIDHVLAVLAAAHIGITVVPVDWRAPQDEKKRIAENFDMKRVLLDRPCPTLAKKGILLDDDLRQQITTCSISCAPCGNYQI
ncbi:MAG: class I adenylate-forming enzyme family protein [Gammaproteobacteria bacterium]|nr:class I adenylate-forming enzyme family protein [Gammaproteobacteria bacterium]MDP7271961.1 class I adenylate-forming enzyme family protein [Gammaproteobacteria bacterium]HJP05556.1 class I adenylate-forming enzyme family protein [Gammaproteobacteria bacterium]